MVFVPAVENVRTAPSASLMLIVKSSMRTSSPSIRWGGTVTTARVMGAGMGGRPRPAKPGISHICWRTFGSERAGVLANADSRSVVWQAPQTSAT